MGPSPNFVDEPRQEHDPRPIMRAPVPTPPGMMSPQQQQQPPRSSFERQVQAELFPSKGGLASGSSGGKKPTRRSSQLSRVHFQEDDPTNSNALGKSYPAMNGANGAEAPAMVAGGQFGQQPGDPNEISYFNGGNPPRKDSNYNDASMEFENGPQTNEMDGAVVSVPNDHNLDDPLDDPLDDEVLDDSSESTNYLNSRRNSSDMSSVGGGTSMSPDSPHSTGSRNRRRNTLAHKETQAVNRSKICVYLVLFVAAVSVGVTTFVILEDDEVDDYENQFKNFAEEILDFADTNAKSFFRDLKTISNTVTSFGTHEFHTNHADQLWPNLTIPHFDGRTTDFAGTVAGPELYLFSPIVNSGQRGKFQEYARENQGWIEEDLALRGLASVDPGAIPDEIYSFTNDQADISQKKSVPIWQVAPVPTNAQIVMLDLYTHPSFARSVDDVLEVQNGLLSEVVDVDFLTQNIGTLKQTEEQKAHPRSYAVQPVFNKFEGDGTVPAERELVGVLFAVIPWNSYFVNTLAPGTGGILVHVQDTCGFSFGYELNGPEARYLGVNPRLPSKKFTKLKETRDFAEFARFSGNRSSEFVRHCDYTISVYPTSQFLDSFKTTKPIWLTTVVVLVFFFTAIVFIMYDFFVQRRQNKVLMTAQRTTAIVSSLFPKNIQKRILDDANDVSGKNNLSSNAKTFRRATLTAKHHLKNFLGEDSGEGPQRVQPTAGVDTLGPQQANEIDTGDYLFQSKPIADFFPDTTIMFADIVGFTAWSSTREPSQVFTLLETIYHEFDQIAKQRRVFKVETVGDCYVAVAGLPDPRKDHAMVMARFGRDCSTQMRVLTKRLEVVLGPDTADLSMRIGLHSGPVTAGVLRGERARFQLFGDTMNTASRMESTGSPGRIQVSREMADELVHAGKGHWIKPRSDKVLVKGKGEMQTYWLEVKGESNSTNGMESSASKVKTAQTDSETSSSGEGHTTQMVMEEEHSEVADEPSVVTMGNKRLTDRLQRLVNWNVDLLSRLLQEVIARRQTKGTAPDPEEHLSGLEKDILHTSENSLAEVCEIIKLPAYRPEFKLANPAAVLLSDEIIEQLRHFITMLALMYHDNPFHNFEHASHVTMSVVKLFSRIVAPDLDHVADTELARSLHDHTYGITSDPLTQFAVILSALIHDADHPGVPNTQLIKEGSGMADVYANKSIAEQNSVDLAWALLMKHQYKELRQALYVTEKEFKRFRQLVVNTVLATDIMDKGLKTLRNSRWDKAFSLEQQSVADSPRDEINRKATIVIEHLIQASDVAHTMQHWHIYRKWNARLFDEMYKAYLSGRSDVDPSQNWYQGEIGFFDFYIIPLAKKLKDCGVFGVSSDEYLQYALNNRNEWERKGEEIVAQLLESAKENHGEAH